MRYLSLYASAWLVAVFSFYLPLVAARQPVRPNIVLIMADDLGWSDLGCYGGEIPTPNIDSLARDGIRFTQFYNNAICGPTRASLLTGLYCQQLGHRGDHWNDPIDFSKCVTLGEVLQSGGYHTMMVGKWQRRVSPLDRGFDRFFGPMCQGKISYFHEVVQDPFYLDCNRWRLPEDFYLTDALNDFAVRFVEEALRDGAPFFLYLAHIAPHWPLHARQTEIASYRHLYESGWNVCRQNRVSRQRQLGLIPESWNPAPWPGSVAPWNKQPHRQWQIERMAVYAAQVAAIDRGVGRLLEVIDRAGQRDNTLILFLSDNGAAPDGGVAPSTSGFGFSPDTDNSRWRLDGVPVRPGSGPDNLPGPPDTFAAYGLAWATVSNTPLRGTKLTGYEGGIRTPLIVRWPAVIEQPGGITHAVGHVIDFMPTFLEAAGAEYPSEFDGRRPLPLEGQSLIPVLRGETPPPRPPLCWSVPHHDAIRVGKWKAIRGRHGGTWQLFDLESDGTETSDLAASQPARVRTMDAQFTAWRTRVGAR